MLRSIHIIAAVLLFTPFVRAADTKETLVVQLLGRDYQTHDLFVADAVTNERLTYRTDTLLRGKNVPYTFRRKSYLKITLSGEGQDRRIVDFEQYNPSALEQQPDIYVFQSAETESTGSKKTLRVKLKRFEFPIEATMHLTPDSEWLSNRITKLKPGAVVTTLFKGTGKSLTITDLDSPRTVIRALYVKSADATLDGKKYPGAIFDVDGEEKAFAFPPAGQKSRPGDSEISAFTRKLKKGQPVCLTFDSERPDVIRSIDYNMVVELIEKNGMRITTAGIMLIARFYDRSTNVLIEPAPVSNADLYLQSGMQQYLYYGPSGMTIGPDGKPIPNPNLGANDITTPRQKMQEITQMVNTFANREDSRGDARQIEARFRQYVATTAVDARKIEASLREAAILLSAKYTPVVTDAYRDARRMLDKDAAKLESIGKIAREAGDTQQ